MEHSLLAVCFTAILAVFILLSALAALIRLIGVIFPARVDIFPEEVPAQSDPTMLAAVATTVASVYPGWRITRIAEEQ